MEMGRMDLRREIVMIGYKLREGTENSAWHTVGIQQILV